jgi:hypothetical protein
MAVNTPSMSNKNNQEGVTTHICTQRPGHLRTPSGSHRKYLARGYRPHDRPQGIG